MSLQESFQKELLMKIKDKLGKKNTLSVPRLNKIVINVGLKDALTNKKLIDSVKNDLMLITGQLPAITRAKKAIAAFKLQAKDKIGLKVTLRGKRMYDFFEKLVTIVLPRVRDFHGVSLTSFDNKGNYTLGLSEYTVFPEIDLSKIEKIRGLEIVIVNSAVNREEGKVLLEILGMPFKKEMKVNKGVKNG